MKIIPEAIRFFAKKKCSTGAAVFFQLIAVIINKVFTKCRKGCMPAAKYNEHVRFVN